MAAGQLGRSPLAKALLGDWDKGALPEQCSVQGRGIWDHTGRIIPLGAADRACHVSRSAAPKAAKSDYEGLLRNVGALLGGEVVGQELQVRCGRWTALVCFSTGRRPPRTGQAPAER